MSRPKIKLNLLVVGLILSLGLLLAGSNWEANASPTKLTPSSNTEFDQIFSHHTVNVNNVKLHYVTGGHGQPLLLLHGWPETWFAWHKVMPALAQNYTLVVPDLPGVGDSSKPETGYDERSVAEDLYGLMHQLGYSNIYLVGHDIGAHIAYAYASLHPTEVKKLVTLGATVPDASFTQIPALVPDQTKGYINYVFNATPDLPEALTVGRERTYLDWVAYKRLSLNPAAISEADIDEYLRTYAAPGGMRGGFAYYRDFFQDIAENQTFAKTKLTMPVMVIGDGLIQDQAIKQMQGLATNVTGVVATNSGHFVAEEQPEFLIQQLLNFLGNNNGK